MPAFKYKDRLTAFCGAYPRVEKAKQFAGKSLVLVIQTDASGKIHRSIRTFDHFEHAEHVAANLVEDFAVMAGQIDQGATVCPLCRTDVVFSRQYNQPVCGADCLFDGPEWDHTGGIFGEDREGLNEW